MKKKLSVLTIPKPLILWKSIASMIASLGAFLKKILVIGMGGKVNFK